MAVSKSLIPEVTTCCKILSLKTGTLIIGALSLAGHVIAIIQLILRITLVHRSYSYMQKKKLSQPEIILAVACNVIAIVYSALMVYGSSKDMPKLMVPYLILDVSTLTVGFIVIWYFILTGFISSMTLGLLHLFIFNVILELTAYSFIIVYNRYKEILHRTIKIIYKHKKRKFINIKDRL